MYLRVVGGKEQGIPGASFQTLVADQGLQDRSGR